MSKKNIDIQEQDLHAYVDKQLSEKKAQAVEELIRKDPQIAAKVHQWQQQNDLITQHFDHKYSDEIPERLNIDKLNQSQKIPSSLPRYYSMAASIFLMLISGMTGWYLKDLSDPIQQNKISFVNSAISAYEVFSVEVLHPVEVSVDKKAHLVSWLSKRVDHPLKVPELQQYGYKLLGGRLLAMKKGQPAAQFMFEDDTGERITLLVSKYTSYNDHSLLFKKDKKVNAFYWMDNNIAYSVSGKVQRDKLKSLSKSVYRQINEGEIPELARL